MHGFVIVYLITFILLLRKTERSDNSDSIITKVVVQVIMHMILKTAFYSGVNSPAVGSLALILVNLKEARQWL